MAYIVMADMRTGLGGDNGRLDAARRHGHILTGTDAFHGLYSYGPR